ncbi:carboxypeptidase-like regulatory domain-containing protein, partial [Flavitalea flava]
MRVSMTMLFFITLLASLKASEGKAQKLTEVKISLQLHRVSLKEAMLQIERVSPFKFLARAEDIEHEQDVTLMVKDQSVSKVLSLLFKGRNIRYKQVGINIILKKEENTKDGRDLFHTVKLQLPEKYTLSGTLKAKKTGETLIGATIRVANAQTGTSSNEYGFYSIALAPGNYTLEISAVGMKRQTIEVIVNGNTVLNISMEEESKDLEEVTIRATTAGRSLKTPQMGLERITMKEIKDVPVLFGERDVLKTIQMLPGIKSAGDGNSGFFVRGGAADQNLILLDEAPVYNPSHLFGFFSTFNSDAIKNVSVYKAGMPAQYGGRLSSVLDIKMNDGNNQDFGISGGVGLIASRLNIEGPIQKDKSSFLISGRRTYADLFLKLSSDTNINRSHLYFYDLNAKANYIFGNKDRLYVSGYFGRDVLSQDNVSGINWGNSTATARWNHLFNSRLFSNTSLIFSNYNFKISNHVQGNEFNIFSQIKDWNLKEELQWYANSRNTVNIGFNAIHHTIRPGEISASKDAGINSMELQRRYSLENAFYATNTWKASDKLSVTYGLRVSAFTILGKGDYYNIDSTGKITDTMHYNSGQAVKTYLNPEPRVAFGYQLNG